MKHLAKRTVKTMLRSILGILLLCTVYISTLSYTKLYFSAKAPSMILGAPQIIGYDGAIHPVIEDLGLSAQVRAAKEQNANTVGWLQIPDSGINFQVMQTNNNDYYLKRDTNEKYSYYGSIFADFRANMGTEENEELSQNMVLYGHHIYRQEGKFFGLLMQYENWDFMAKHPYIYFSTENADYVYQIFSVFYTLTDFDYIQPNPTQEQFAEILQRGQESSLYITQVPVSTEDKILTLSTCMYKYRNSAGKFRDDQRFVVAAKLISATNPPDYRVPETNPSPKLPL